MIYMRYFPFSIKNDNIINIYKRHLVKKPTITLTLVLGFLFSLGGLYVGSYLSFASIKYINLFLVIMYNRPPINSFYPTDSVKSKFKNNKANITRCFNT